MRAACGRIPAIALAVVLATTGTGLADATGHQRMEQEFQNSQGNTGTDNHPWDHHRPPRHDKPVRRLPHKIAPHPPTNTSNNNNPGGGPTQSGPCSKSDPANDPGWFNSCYSNCRNGGDDATSCNHSCGGDC